MNDEQAYAGFWLRFLAAVIDTVIAALFGLVVAIFFITAFGFLSYTETMNSALSTVFFVLYHTIMEGSTYQATVGKMLVGIQVTDKEGNQITYLRALGRTFAKYLSAIILFIGYIMAAFTKRKQALHDIIAGCLVVQDPDTEPQVGRAIGAAVVGLLLTVFISGYYATNYLFPKLAATLTEELVDMDVTFNITPPSQDGGTVEGQITIKKKGKEATFDLSNGKVTEKTTSQVEAVATADTSAKENKEEKPYRYIRRSRRDPFQPLLTKGIVKEEMKRKREKEMAKAREEMEQATAAGQDISDLLSELFAEDAKQALAPPVPEITFPDVKIAGIMWDPYDPVLTLTESDNIYRTGDLISDDDGLTYVVLIMPDSITIEKNQNGRVKQKQIGIIRVEEGFSQ